MFFYNFEHILDFNPCFMYPTADSASSETLSKKIEEKISALSSLAQDIPAVTIVHNVQDTSVEYMSESGLKILGVTLNQLKAMGPAYHDRFFNPEFAVVYVPKIFGLLARNKDGEVVSYFQQVRSSPEKNWTWFLSCTKVFLRDDEGKPLLTITNAVPMDEDHYVEAAKAKRLLDESTFIRQHHHLFHKLSRREKEILKLTAMGNSTAEIAKKLFISEATASTHRRNIRAKLKAETTYDLTRFAQAFDLI